MRILVLMGTAFGSVGGIQRINRHIAKALTEARTKPRDAAVRMLCLTDRNDQVDIRYVGGPETSFRGFGGNRWIFSLAALRLAQHWRPDLVLATHVNLAPLAALLCQLCLARRYAVVVYGIDVWRQLPILRRLALRQADVIISISRFTAKRMQTANGTNPTRVRVLPLCLDPYWIQETAALNGHSPDIELPASPRLLAVSRLALTERYKGHEEVILSLRRIKERIPHISFIIVGDGDLRPYLQELAWRTGVADQVIFPGQHVGNTTLCAYYEAADLFVMPSRKEGFGLVFLEAMYHRLPVVAGNQDATPEVVRHGETGLLVDPTDPQGIAEAVIRLLENDELRGEMGRRGHDLVMQKYTFEHFATNLWNILGECAS